MLTPEREPEKERVNLSFFSCGCSTELTQARAREENRGAKRDFFSETQTCKGQQQ